jgi:Uma2 family endonuclease
VLLAVSSRRLAYTLLWYEHIGGPVQTQTKAETQIRQRRFTVDEFHRMAEAGILHEDDRVELIAGEIVEMSPIGGRHAKCVTELTRVLTSLVGEDMRVSPQNPVELDEHEEPQPDVAVRRAGERYRAGALPIPEDIVLLIEVADTSLTFDRDVKLPLYARSGIEEVWLVDLNASVIERHTEPSESGYRLLRRSGRGETLKSTVLSGLAVAVDAVLS